MNALRSLIVIGFLCGLSIGAKAQFEKAEVQVSGMTCSMCQLSVQKALQTLDYISHIKPNLNTNSYILTFRKDKIVNLELIKKKIKDSGFSVSKFIATFHFNKITVNNNSEFNYEDVSYRFLNNPNKVLNGDVDLLLVSNGYLSTSDFKKYVIQTVDPSYAKGLGSKVKVLHVVLASNQ